MSGEGLRGRTRISQTMSERPLRLSSFGRAFFSQLRKDFPPEEYAAFVTRWNTRYKTRTTSLPRSKEGSMVFVRQPGRNDQGRRPVPAILAKRSPFEQGLFGRLAEETSALELEAALKEWDELRERRRRERKRSSG